MDPLQTIIAGLLRDIGTGATNGSDWWDPISVVPTQDQIDRAVERGQFSEIPNPISNVCPIRQTEFEPTDNVTRITRCGHVFGSDELTEWFTRSTVCPVCRCDIRDVSNNQPDMGTNGEGEEDDGELPNHNGITIDVDIPFESPLDPSYTTGILENMRVDGSYLSGYGGFITEGGDGNRITIELRDGSGNMMRRRNFNME